MWDVWGCLYSVPDYLPTLEAIQRDLLYLSLLAAWNLENPYLNAKLYQFFFILLVAIQKYLPINYYILNLFIYWSV